MQLLKIIPIILVVVVVHVFPLDPRELVRHLLILLGSVRDLNILLKYFLEKKVIFKHPD